MSLLDYLSTQPKKIPVSLTIAGSDSGGGAGIQADLKTFAALRCYGQSVITAVTAQNTTQVLSIHELPTNIIYDQIKAASMDIGVDAFKSGMLSSAKIIRTISRAIVEFGLKNYVLDPVMVAKSGAKLLLDNAIQTLKNELLPLALIVTPNVPEAEVLTGLKIADESSIKEAALMIAEMGPEYVLIKGGHLHGDPVDWVYGHNKLFAIPEKRIDTKNTHGSGCTLSAAIVSFLARGYSADKAIREAKSYVHKGIIYALDIGSGHGPLHHYHNLYKY